MPCRSSNARRPARTSAWSSARAMRARMRRHAAVHSCRQARLDAQRAARRRWTARGCRRRRRALAHAGQAVAFAQRAAHAAVVFDPDAQPAARRSVSATRTMSASAWRALLVSASCTRRRIASATAGSVDLHVVVDAQAQRRPRHRRGQRAQRGGQVEAAIVAHRLHDAADVAEQFARQLLRDGDLLRGRRTRDRRRARAG